MYRIPDDSDLWDCSANMPVCTSINRDLNYIVLANAGIWHYMCTIDKLEKKHFNLKLV